MILTKTDLSHFAILNGRLVRLTGPRRGPITARTTTVSGKRYRVSEIIDALRYMDETQPEWRAPVQDRIPHYIPNNVLRNFSVRNGQLIRIAGQGAPLGPIKGRMVCINGVRYSTEDLTWEVQWRDRTKPGWRRE